VAVRESGDSTQDATGWRAGRQAGMVINRWTC